MLKVALLYADKVTLHSPIAAIFMNATESATNFTTLERLQLMVRIAPLLSPDHEENYRHQLEVYELLNRKEEKFLVVQTRHKRARQLVPVGVRDSLKSIYSGKKTIEDKGQKDWAKLNESTESLRQFLGIDKLDKAVEAGLLTVNRLESDKVSGYELLVRLGPGNYDIEHLISEPASAMTREIMNLMFSPNDSYLFVDNKFGDVFQLAKQTSGQNPQLNQVQKEKAKNVFLVSHMFSVLPRFEGAAFDEVLDINSELSRPLIRFRSAVAEYAELIESTSWDSDFEAEAAKVFEEKIKPSILEIEERIEDNSLSSSAHQPS